MATTTGSYKAECAISHAIFEAGFRDGEDGSATTTARAVSEEHPSWDDMMVTVYLNGAEDGARGDRFRLGLVCGLCGPMSEPELTDDGWQVLDGWQDGDSFPARLVPAAVAVPVVVGEVWEGVLEFKTVTVLSVTKDGQHVSYRRSILGPRWHAEHCGLAEFRERFTRRGR